MMEVFTHPEHIALWQDAVDGKAVDWDALMHGYAAAVDWPASAFWRELAAANPDAVVLLSTRASADAWWESADATIFEISRREPPPDPTFLAHRKMVVDLFSRRFTPAWRDARDAKRAYEDHNAAVRASVPPERLVEWRPGDGWAPICAALDLAVPAAPFPHVNTTDEFRAMAGLDAQP